MLNTMLVILLFVCIFSATYFFVELCAYAKLNQRITNIINSKNEKYYRDLLDYYNKNKKIKLTTKLNLIYRINILIDKAGLERNIIINPITIIIFSALSFVITYFFVYGFFKIILLSAIISIPAIFAPIFILGKAKERNSKKIEDIMLDFLLQLKNYTRINNDIIYALKQVKTLEPLQGYINKFLIELNSGIKFEKAIENLKDKIGFDSLRTVLSNIQYCYLYGGDFSVLMDKSYKTIGKIQNEKKERYQETKSARIVLRCFNCA